MGDDAHCRGRPGGVLMKAVSGAYPDRSSHTDSVRRAACRPGADASNSRSSSHPGDLTGRELKPSAGLQCYWCLRLGCRAIPEHDTEMQRPSALPDGQQAVCVADAGNADLLDAAEAFGQVWRVQSSRNVPLHLPFQSRGSITTVTFTSPFICPVLL